MPITLGDIICKRVKELSYQKGWNKEILAEKSGLSVDTIKNIWNGKTPDPRTSTCLQLSEAFGITVNCLVGKCSHSPKERAILNHYRSCGRHGQDIIESVAKFEAISAKASREAIGKHPIPCIIPKGDVTQGIVYEINGGETILTSVDEACIALKITTNDFVPVFLEDDILLFENRFPKTGEYGGFYIGGRLFLRQYLKEDKQHILKCLHNKGADMIYQRLDCIEYMGTVIDVVRD
jgi:transcriptional regulator with XRE-family HTH domain